MTTLTHLDAISDRALKRMVTWGAVVLAVLLVTFGALYFFGQRTSTGPNLAERQVSSAEAAVKANPENVQVRLKLAAAYQAVGRYDDAASQYDEILKAMPMNASALIGAGNVKVAQKDLDGAKVMFSKITQAPAGEFSSVDPNVEAAHYYLGSIASTQGDLDAAMKELDAALKIDQTDADALYLMATIQAKKGDDKSAVQNLQEAVLFVPTGWCEPYTAMASSYGKLGEADMAEYAGAMNDFCSKNTDSATSRLEKLTSGKAAVPSLLGLGLVAETTSDRTAAISWYQKALVASPNNPTAISALGRLGVTPTSTATNAKVK